MQKRNIQINTWFVQWWLMPRRKIKQGKETRSNRDVSLVQNTKEGLSDKMTFEQRPEGNEWVMQLLKEGKNPGWADCIVKAGVCLGDWGGVKEAIVVGVEWARRDGREGEVGQRRRGKIINFVLLSNSVNCNLHPLLIQCCIGRGWRESPKEMSLRLYLTLMLLRWASHFVPRQSIGN